MVKNRKLFVEGADDFHAIMALLKHFSVKKDAFVVGVPDNKGKIGDDMPRNEFGGLENVLKATKLNLIAGSDSVERLGIVIDADQDLNKQWERVISILENAKYKNLPSQPDPDGTIIKQDYMPIFGIWIMPDNVTERGMLEDFLEFLVPDKESNPVWNKAVESSKEILETVDKELRFSKIHLSKAKIHAYLAWQKDCGVPFGLSITKKYLQPDNESSKKFIEWLNRLFVNV